MKIAFCFLTYGKDIFGGIENALYNLTKGIKETGHDPFVFTSGKYSKKMNLPAKIYISEHLPTSYDGNTQNLIMALKRKSAEVNKDFDNFIAIHQPDWVIVVDPIWGILPVTNYNIKSDVSYAISYHIANLWADTQEIMRKSFSMPFDKFLSVSMFLSDEIRNSFPEAKAVSLETLPNSINANNYATHSQPRREYIFCNSRIAKSKNVETLVAAFAQIHHRYPNLLLKLCGGKFPFADESEEYAKINNLIQKHKISKKVEILPLLSWSEIPQMVSSAKLVVLPSLYETFGIAALEASVSGTPLIVASATNFKQLVKHSAIFYEPKNTNELAEKICQVVSNYEKYLQEASNKSQFYKDKYDNKAVARKLIDEILNNNLQ